VSTSGKHRNHSNEFKDQAVRMVLAEHRRVTEVARSLGLSASLLETWIKSYKTTGSAAGVGRGQGKKDPDKERIKQLEQELERVKMERDILKKAAAYFAKESL